MSSHEAMSLDYFLNQYKVTSSAAAQSQEGVGGTRAAAADFGGGARTKTCCSVSCVLKTIYKLSTWLLFLPALISSKIASEVIRWIFLLIPQAYTWGEFDATVADLIANNDTRVPGFIKVTVPAPLLLGMAYALSLVVPYVLVQPEQAKALYDKEVSTQQKAIRDAKTRCDRAKAIITAASIAVCAILFTSSGSLFYFPVVVTPAEFVQNSSFPLLKASYQWILDNAIANAINIGLFVYASWMIMAESGLKLAKSMVQSTANFFSSPTKRATNRVRGKLQAFSQRVDWGPFMDYLAKQKGLGENFSDDKTPEDVSEHVSDKQLLSYLFYQQSNKNAAVEAGLGFTHFVNVFVLNDGFLGFILAALRDFGMMLGFAASATNAILCVWFSKILVDALAQLCMQEKPKISSWWYAGPISAVIVLSLWMTSYVNLPTDYETALAGCAYSTNNISYTSGNATLLMDCPDGSSGFFLADILTGISTAVIYNLVLLLALAKGGNRFLLKKHKPEVANRLDIIDALKKRLTNAINSSDAISRFFGQTFDGNHSDMAKLVFNALWGGEVMANPREGEKHPASVAQTIIALVKIGGENSKARATTMVQQLSLADAVREGGSPDTYADESDGPLENMLLTPVVPGNAGNIVLVEELSRCWRYVSMVITGLLINAAPFVVTGMSLSEKPAYWLNTLDDMWNPVNLVAFSVVWVTAVAADFIALGQFLRHKFMSPRVFRLNKKDGYELERPILPKWLYIVLTLLASLLVILPMPFVYHAIEVFLLANVGLDALAYDEDTRRSMELTLLNVALAGLTMVSMVISKTVVGCALKSGCGKPAKPGDHAFSGVLMSRRQSRTRRGSGRSIASIFNENDGTESLLSDGEEEQGNHLLAHVESVHTLSPAQRGEV